MQKVVFRSPGLLDPRGITTFGINSKPNSNNPIGFFGTGLKYAIAVLLRHDCQIDMVIGKKAYDFAKVKGTFRDKDFDFIEMSTYGFLGAQKRERLPFTTELGKNWKLWQAFRELYSNTIDEDGTTLVMPGDQSVETGPFETTISVWGDAFAEECHNKDNSFLPDGLRVRDNASVQILPRKSKHIYYRGMRVKDLPTTSMVTYNILAPLELTEDRTLKYDFYMDHYIRNAVVTQQDPDIIQTVLTAPEKTFEYKIDFKEASEAPSPIFDFVIKKLREDKRGPVFNHSALSYSREYDPIYIQRQNQRHWADKMADLVEQEEWNKVQDFAREHKDKLHEALRRLANMEVEIPLHATIQPNPYEDETT